MKTKDIKENMQLRQMNKNTFAMKYTDENKSKEQKKEKVELICIKL